ncbi:hypothetical protein GCM10023149_11050 [Mucilaginibacter gynuensis]|uniref:Uncharacterized protein n=1 Tax=Mucilaginibacter gynuensis TaxID=1302236 RepID=A0ABP8G0G8_9SPHI
MQRFFIIILLLAGFTVSAQLGNHQAKQTEKIPAFLIGDFVDDYGIKYSINDTLWLQKPRSKFHIIKWNIKEQYLIARNDDKNPGEGGLYTRIDFMQFSKMEPWLWGYCLSVYDAQNDSIAEVTAHADRQNPKRGCNGYPFSRMKRVQ